MERLEIGQFVFGVATACRIDKDGDVRWVDWGLQTVSGFTVEGRAVAHGYVKSNGCHEVQSMQFHGCIPEELDAVLRATREAVKIAAKKLAFSEVEW